MLHAPFRECMAQEPTWTTAHDVIAWTNGGYDQPLASYLHKVPVSFDLQVDEKTKKLIETKIDMFGEHAQGLGKFTRTMFARDLRRTLIKSRD